MRKATTVSLYDAKGGRTKPHVIKGDESSGPLDGHVIAKVHPASGRAVQRVLSQSVTDDGRSDWCWLRLPDGTLMLGVFPRGDTYFSVEEDAQFPTTGEPL